MKKLFLVLTAVVTFSQAIAQVNYDANVVPIFGGGNPEGEWNAVQENGFVLAARAKERFVTPVMYHEDEVYFMPLQVIPLNRSSYNIELSVQNLNGVIGDVDVYLMVDNDSSVGINYLTANVLTTWGDNSYGDVNTPNGGGVEGTEAQYASTYSIVQLSQNLGFGEFANLGIQNPAAASTYDFVLYVVAKGAGPNAEPIASIQIQVVTGEGGASVEDLINAIDTTGMNHGDYVNAVKAIAKYLFDGGVLNNKQMAGLISTAAKSNIGK